VVWTTDPQARGTGVVRRDAGLSHLLDEIVHVHVDLRHDLAPTIPPDFARFLPHAERLVDPRRRFVVFRLDQVSRFFEPLAASVVLGHHDRSSRGPGVESDSPEDVVLADHGGRMPAGDERPGPPIEAFPGAHRVIQRNCRGPYGRINRQQRGAKMGLSIARDHLTVFAQDRPADHATGVGQAPPAISAAFTLSQVGSDLPEILARLPGVEAFRWNPQT